MNETDIIKGCLKNDRASQKALYELFYSKMSGVCLRYSKNNDEAKDILREGFLNIFKTLRNFNQSDALETWIRNTIVHTAVDHLRTNKQNLIVSTVYANQKAADLTAAMSEDDLVQNIDKEKILKAVQELTPAYRTVFNLYVVEEYTHDRIAKLLDISEETSKLNLSKAKFNLKQNLIHLVKTAYAK